jgi:hypothetical protein
MRKLTLDDIRLSANSNVIAAPMWSYKNERWGWQLIDEAWADIIAELNRRRDAISRTEGVGILRGRVQRGHSYQILFPYLARGIPCQVCGNWFMSRKDGNHAKVCTQNCLLARRKHRNEQSTAKRPVVSHDLRPCAQCGKPVAPQRTDARFCSVHCRVAHRRQKGNT